MSKVIKHIGHTRQKTYKPRLKKKEKKDQEIKIRLTREQIEGLRKQAEKHHTTMSGMIRRSIFVKGDRDDLSWIEELDKQIAPQRKTEITRDEYSRLVVSISRIGNNLNQIAHVLNADHNKRNNPELLNQLKNQLKQVNKKIIRFLGN